MVHIFNQNKESYHLGLLDFGLCPVRYPDISGLTKLPNLISNRELQHIIFIPCTVHGITDKLCTTNCAPL
jgi:hypothetical protein